MLRLFLLTVLISQAALATSMIEPALDGSNVIPRFSNYPGYYVPELPRPKRECGPVINSGTTLTPEIKNEMMDILSSLDQRVGNPDFDDANDEENAKKLLADMMKGFQKKNVPIFIDPKTGNLIYSNDLDKPKTGEGVDQLKACISRTKCTGTGKDRECTTWEGCVSSD